ncbi:uncharacterized protein [Linepithema humile]|uniref:uncharacterized protein isoform X2 n=1 Tax=Linepithema humile TaxID=83485 RepID=UPI0006232DD3|nr:PREDICTED: uncharacterized protein LOC105668042 isoform X2 [Linepithema humile]
MPFPTVCKRNSTNYSNCLKLAIEEAWPKLIKGLPEFDFPPLDPMTYEFGSAVFDINAIHGEANVSNFVFEGMAKTRFVAVKVNFVDDNFQAVVDLQVPKLAGAGEYEAVGTLAGFRINGKGYFNLTAEDISGPQIITGYVANDRLIIEHVIVAPSIKNLKVYFDLFNSNKEINDLILTFVNEYWPFLYRAVLPTATKVWEPWLCDLANRFFSKVSFTKLFA